MKHKAQENEGLSRLSQACFESIENVNLTKETAQISSSIEKLLAKEQGITWRGKLQALQLYERFIYQITKEILSY